MIEYYRKAQEERFFDGEEVRNCELEFAEERSAVQDVRRKGRKGDLCRLFLRPSGRK